MLQNNRIIHSDNGTIRDLTISLNNALSGDETVAIVAAEDAIYLGSDFPFNHRFIDVTTANDVASAISVSIWDGANWNAAVDVIDQTSVAGVCLAQDGVLSWVPNRDKSWGRQEDSNNIPALAGTHIYDLYWVKLTFSGNLKATTSIRHVGHKFSTDADLFAQYPDLENTSLMTAFKSGKTTWHDQHILAAEYIVQGLREKNVIVSGNQVIDWMHFKLASVHKTAEIIYGAFGDDYKDNKAAAALDYSKSFNIKVYNVDLNKNARLDPIEKTQASEFLSR